MKWYRAHFPSLPYMKLITYLNKRQQSYSITGEATPYYMFHPSTKKYLLEYFEPYNQELYELTEIRFD